MVDKFKAVVVVQTTVILVLIGLLVSHTHIMPASTRQNNLLALATRYDSEETRASVISFEPLRESMLEFIRDNTLDVAVYVVNLRNGVSFGVNEEKGAFPASLNKVPVAIMAMREVEKGNLKMDSMVPITGDIIKSNSVLFSTSNEAITLAPIADDIYKNNKELPLHVLMENMLQKSDNNALRILSTQINKKDLLEFYSYIDVDAYGSYDYAASKVSNRLLSAKALSNIFLSLYHSTILEPKNSQYILSLLADTTFDARKIAQLPPHVKIAHKFGVYDDAKMAHMFRDCGIIYSGKSRVLYCIVIQNQPEGEAINLTGRMIKAIHNYVLNNEITLDEHQRRNTSITI